MQLMRLLGCGLLWLPLVSGCQPAEPTGWSSGAITDGTKDSGHLAVGLLMLGTIDGKAANVCSGTLVGPKTVLTAAHCLIPRSGETIFRLFDAASEHRRDYPAKELVGHRSWEPNNYRHDIGLVLLEDAPAGVKPLRLAARGPKKSERVRFVGFGVTVVKGGDAGTRRTGTNTVVSVGSAHFTAQGTGGGNSNVCDGDSGGPVFLVSPGQPEHDTVAGVISARDGSGGCGRLSYHVTVTEYAEWLKKNAAGDLGTVGDTEKPTIIISSPADQATVPAPVLLTFTATDDAGPPVVSLAVDGKQTDADVASPVAVDLSPGQHTLTLFAKDAAGNSAAASVTITVEGRQDLGLQTPADGGIDSSGSSTSGYGDRCLDDEHCASGMCRAMPGRAGAKACTKSCVTEEASCPDDNACRTLGSEAYCIPPARGAGLEGGCAVGGKYPIPMLALLGLALWALRRVRSLFRRTI